MNVEGRVIGKTNIITSQNQNQYFLFTLIDKTDESKILASKRMIKYYEQIKEDSVTI